MNISEIPVKDIIILDMGNEATDIEIKLSQYLKEPPKGIYIPTKVDPVLVDGNDYYFRSKNKSLLLTDITKVKDSSIYDNMGNVVIPACYINNKEKMLTNTPSISYRGFKLIEIIIVEEIYKSLAYMGPHHDLNKRIKAHIDPNVNDDNVEEIIDTLYFICNPLLVAVRRFIGNDDWFIYTPRFKNMKFTIEKNMDKRIYEWYQMKERENV